MADLIKNLDLKEISKFDSNAVTWWNIDGEFKFLHKINLIRLNYILERSGGIFSKSVLDVGCGGGILAESMAAEGAKVTGLDMSAKSLAVARKHALENHLTISYYQQTIEEHATVYHDMYDIVTCMEVLEHVPNPASVIRSCANLVKPGGEVFCSTLNRNYKSHFMSIICAEYIFQIVPKGTHNIMKYIKPAELLSWADSVSLQDKHIIGLRYNILKDYFCFDKNIDVNYILHMRRQG